MTDAVREALEAALDVYMDCGDPPYYREESRPVLADAIAAFLRALPSLVVHYRDTSKPIGSFGSTPMRIGEDLAAAVEQAAKEPRV